MRSEPSAGSEGYEQPWHWTSLLGLNNPTVLTALVRLGLASRGIRYSDPNPPAIQAVCEMQARLDAVDPKKSLPGQRCAFNPRDGLRHPSRVEYVSTLQNGGDTGSVCVFEPFMKGIMMSNPEEFEYSPPVKGKGS